VHQLFVTTTRGLDRNALPMRLFEKAKRLGIWNPSDIDLTRDEHNWQALDPAERDLLLRLTALFQAGEEAVTLDLLPLIQVIASEGRLEEELFLTTFLWEEAKHTDFFRRFLDEVAHQTGDLSGYHTWSYRALVHQALPEAMNRLRHDPSPEAQALASLTYNMIVEGVLAETGYHAYFTVLEQHDILPGTRRAVELLKQDESRHIAYGVFLLSRLVAADPALWELVSLRMGELLVLALGVVDEAFTCYDPVPFGLALEDFTGYALGQFERRLERLEHAARACDVPRSDEG
jgi:ribonucleoside-diphosphate reductase beta chain